MKRVLFIQYTNPAAYPPLEHIASILGREGWSMLFLGINSFKSDELSFRAQPLVEVRKMNLCSPGWRQKFHFLQFILWTVFWTIRRRPDWIYASDQWSCPAALLISYIPGIRIIYHEHDSPAAYANTFFQRMAQAARLKLAHRAEQCVLPNKERARLFAEEIGNADNVTCVWNCPLLEEV